MQGQLLLRERCKSAVVQRPKPSKTSFPQTKARKKARGIGQRSRREHKQKRVKRQKRQKGERTKDKKQEKKGQRWRRKEQTGQGKGRREGERGKQRHSQREKRARVHTGPGKSWRWRKERAILGITITYGKLQRAVAVPVAQPAGTVRYVLYDHSMVSARGPWLHTVPIPGSVINLPCFMMITLVCTKDILRNIYRVPCHIFWTKCMEYLVGL